MRQTCRRAALCLALALAAPPLAAGTPPALLTDPLLQWPTADGVHVVWFTEFEGQGHAVLLDGREIPATTTKMSRLAEDDRSHVHGQPGDGTLYPGWTPRDVWRHEAYVDGLTARVPYRVRSVDETGAEATSDSFTLAPLPAPGQPLTILLTSDHQLMEMTPANLQKVAETVGRVDAVVFAGDLQNIPDRASEWFDDDRGFAFFPSLQGRAHRLTPSGDGTTETLYTGGALIQHAPLFPVIGNHETMGRFRPALGLNRMYNDPRPLHAAEALYEAHAETFNPTGDPQVRADWLRDNTFNTITYEEIFTLPDDGPKGERFYEIRFGDLHIVALHATRIFRPPNPAVPRANKYFEQDVDLGTPDAWGWGDFLFEDLARGSVQHDWLSAVLAREDVRQAPLTLAVAHQAPHGLGDNANPVFTHPVQVLDTDAAGRLTGIRYEYPKAADIFVNDVEPLLVEAGVDLVLMGHSHVWNRLESPAGLRFLESSNVGNSYGCHAEGHATRGNLPSRPGHDMSNYTPSGSPHGYAAALPSEFAPMTAADGTPLPCVASNTLTVFSVLTTGPSGAEVASYVYDTADPGSPVRLFDRFALD